MNFKLVGWAGWMNNFKPTGHQTIFWVWNTCGYTHIHRWQEKLFTHSHSFFKHTGLTDVLATFCSAFCVFAVVTHSLSLLLFLSWLHCRLANRTLVFPIAAFFLSKALFRTSLLVDTEQWSKQMHKQKTHCHALSESYFGSFMFISPLWYHYIFFSLIHCAPTLLLKGWQGWATMLGKPHTNTEMWVGSKCPAACYAPLPGYATGCRIKFWPRQPPLQPFDRGEMRKHPCTMHCMHVKEPQVAKINPRSPTMACLIIRSGFWHAKP